MTMTNLQDPANHFAGTEYALYYDCPPAVEEEGVRRWLARGQNFLVDYALFAGSGQLERRNHPDEYLLLLPDADTSAQVETPHEAISIDGFSLTILPPGDSRVSLKGTGQAIRIFSTRAADLVEMCMNKASYLRPHPFVAGLQDWPAPPGGYRLRNYSLDVPESPDRFGRIFRSTNLMINFLYPRIGVRDPSNLSPHHHDDFEQGSLAIQGDYLHCVRWPWLKDKRTWRADEQILCHSPSLCVIPPPAIHTSQAMGLGVNQLIDIFAPPRLDFSMKPGAVLNADDYPLPE